MRFRFEIKNADGGWRDEFRRLTTWADAEQVADRIAASSGVVEVRVTKAGE